VVSMQLVVTIGVQFRDCGSSLMGTPMGFAMLSNFQTSSFGICYAIKLPDFVYQLLRGRQMKSHVLIHTVNGTEYTVYSI